MLFDDVNEVSKRTISPLIEPSIEEKLEKEADSLVSADNFDEAVDKLAEKKVKQIRAELFGEPPQPPQFPSFMEFFITVLAPMYGTTSGRRANWSAKWYQHPEIVLRIHELWTRYEKMRLQEPETFMESFLRIHADYHMDRMMRTDGVMSDCSFQDTPTIPLPTARSVNQNHKES